MTPADLTESIQRLKKRNRLFKGALTAHELVGVDCMEGEEDKDEEVRPRTVEEIVEEVMNERSRADGEDIDEGVSKEGQDCDDSDTEELPSLVEMMEAAMKLEKGVQGVGKCGAELSKVCRKFRAEVRRLINEEAMQATLEKYWKPGP